MKSSPACSRSILNAPPPSNPPQKSRPQNHTRRARRRRTKCCDAMGLTIHFDLSLRAEPHGLDDMRARWAVEEARRLAMKMKRRGAFEEVGPLRWDAFARSMVLDWLTIPVPGQPHTSTGVEISPVEGHVFCIGVGRDCEPLWL